MKQEVFDPLVTYRLQLHKGFGFKAVKKIIPYLSGLGIKTIYASPIFSASPGSEHGYDGIDPLSINPEIGSLEELYEVSAMLKKNGMGWIQDFVPNHMAFHTDNKWLMDVLEKGKHSTYASFFDIQWNNPETNGKVMVPFLGDPLEKILEKGELQIKLAENKLWVDYFGSSWPLTLSSYAMVLSDTNSQSISDWLHLLNEMEKLPFSN